jgi:hypothetical protein
VAEQSSPKTPPDRCMIWCLPIGSKSCLNKNFLCLLILHWQCCVPQLMPLVQQQPPSGAAVKGIWQRQNAQCSWGHVAKGWAMLPWPQCWKANMAKQKAMPCFHGPNAMGPYILAWPVVLCSSQAMEACHCFLQRGLCFFFDAFHELWETAKA